MCTRNFCDYNKYYSDQLGGKLDISFYQGQPHQRGYGRFSNLTKRYGIPVTNYLLRSGKDFGVETLSGFKKGLKKVAKKGIQQIIDGQLGEGLSRKPSKKKTTMKQKKNSKSKRKSVKKSKSKVKNIRKLKKVKFTDIFK